MADLTANPTVVNPSHEGQVDHGHDHGHHDDHHHEETFLTKYIFSMDHKMISKQFLITGIFWAFIGGAMSLLLDYSLHGLSQLFLSWKRF